MIYGKPLPWPAAIPLPGGRPGPDPTMDSSGCEFRQATARVIPARQPRTEMPPTAVQARRLLRNRPSQEAAARIPGQCSRLRLARKAYGYNRKRVPLRSYRTNSRHARPPATRDGALSPIELFPVPA